MSEKFIVKENKKSKATFVDLGNTKENKLRIVCISDTHEKLKDLMETTEIPNGDVLIHCGGKKFKIFF